MIRLFKAEKKPQNRGLAAAGGADDGHILAAPDLDIQVFKHRRHVGRVAEGDVPQGDVSVELPDHFLFAAGFRREIHDRLQYPEHGKGIGKAHGVGADRGQGAGENGVGREKGEKVGLGNVRLHGGGIHGDRTREHDDRRQDAENLQEKRRIVDRADRLPVYARPDGEGPFLGPGKSDFLHAVDQAVGQAVFLRLIAHSVRADIGLSADDNRVQEDQDKGDRQSDARGGGGIDKHLGQADQRTGGRQDCGKEHVQQQLQIDVERADPGTQIAGGKLLQSARRSGQDPHHKRGLQRDGDLGADADKNHLLHACDEEGRGSRKNQNGENDVQQPQIGKGNHVGHEQLCHHRRDHAQQQGRDGCREQQQDFREGDRIADELPEILCVDFPRGQRTVIQGRFRLETAGKAFRDPDSFSGIGILKEIAPGPCRNQDDGPAVREGTQHHADRVFVPAVLQLHLPPHDSPGTEQVFLHPFLAALGIGGIGDRNIQAASQLLHDDGSADMLVSRSACGAFAHDDIGQIPKCFVKHFLFQPGFILLSFIEKAQENTLSCFGSGRRTVRSVPEARHACPARQSFPDPGR